MAKIFITGDTHTEKTIKERFNTKNFPEGKELTKEDIVIITGDFGMVFFPENQQNVAKKLKTDEACLKWLNEKPWTTLFIDGNHENFDRLNKLPIIELFGGKVGVVRDSIFHLKRGEIYTINDKTFLAFGGAETENKNPKKIYYVGSRVKEKDYEYKTYWTEEIPSKEEYENALYNLKLHNFEVDYILTHTINTQLVEEVITLKNKVERDVNDHKGMIRITDETAKMIENIFNLTKYKQSFFGHFHIDKGFNNNKNICVYKEIIELF